MDENLNNETPVTPDENVVEKKEVKFRHPQQILTNKEIQILFEKQAQINEAKAEIEKNGGDPETIEGLTVEEEGAIKLFLLRARNHKSTPKVQFTKRQNKARRKARRTSKNSRKQNR